MITKTLRSAKQERKERHLVSKASQKKFIDHTVFEQIEFKIGTIMKVEMHPSLQEYVILINAGAGKPYQVVADLRQSYTARELQGKQVLIVTNIKPENVAGVESNCMLVLAVREGKAVLVSPDKPTHSGSRVWGAMDSLCRYFDPSVQP